MKKIIVMLVFCLLSVSLFPQEQVKKTVAVLKFEGGSGQDAITLADLFGTRLANKDMVNVVTRTSVDAIMSEHNFQRLGVTDSENIKAIGELVNADYIVVGKITMLGNKNVLTVQIINVVSGNIESGGDVSFVNISDTYNHMDNLVASMVGSGNISTTAILNNTSNLNITTMAMYEGREGIVLIKALISNNINAIDDNGYTPLIIASSYGYTALVKELIAAGANINAESYGGGNAYTIARLNKHERVMEVLVEAGADTKTYEIGTKGPGGGIVFYKKSDKIFEVSDNLGTANNWNDAKTLAKNYRGGGYDDWYLPSEGELKYIYENLAKKGFIKRSGRFWSSTEVTSIYAQSLSFYTGGIFSLSKSSGDVGGQSIFRKSKDTGANVRAVRSFKPFNPS